MSTRTLLVVDDQPDILEVVRLAIEVTTQWSVVTASSVAEAAEAADAATGPTVDAVLLDLSVTNHDAPAAVARLGDATGGAPVILLTGRTLPAAEVAQTAAAGYIAKPFDPMSLADDIAKTLGWPAVG